MMKEGCSEDNTNISINSAADARKLIGKRVFWDDISVRYVFLRQGIVDDVSGKNICIDGNWETRSSLKNLRNYENGGEWARVTRVKSQR